MKYGLNKDLFTSLNIVSIYAILDILCLFIFLFFLLLKFSHNYLHLYCKDKNVDKET